MHIKRIPIKNRRDLASRQQSLSLTCRQAGCGGRGAGERGERGYRCRGFSSGGTSRGGGRRGPGGQRLAPLQQLLVLLLAEARGHLSRRVALLEQVLRLLCCLRLTSRGGALAIATARGCRRDGTGAVGGKRRGGVSPGRVWHCGDGRVGGEGTGVGGAGTQG